MIIICIVYLFNIYKVSMPIFSLLISCILLNTFLLVYGIFDRNYSSYQFLYNLVLGQPNLIDFNLVCGIDGISLNFLILTTFIFVLIFLSSWRYNILFIVEYCVCFLSLEGFLIMSFLAVDLLTFFFFFESLLIPMFIIIGLWGSLNRKIYASLLFFIYTMVGSILLLFALLTVHSELGTYNFSILSKSEITYFKQVILWIFVYVAFIIKIPTYPFHIISLIIFNSNMYRSLNF